MNRMIFWGGRRPCPAVVQWITRHEGDRPAVEPGQASNDRTPEGAAHLEKAVAVDDLLDDATHQVGVTRIAGDDGQQSLAIPLGLFAATGARRHVPNRIRQI